MKGKILREGFDKNLNEVKSKLYFRLRYAILNMQ